MPDTVEIVLTVQVAAPPAKIWSVIRRFQDAATWNMCFLSSSLISGTPDEIGAEREVITSDGIAIRERLTEFDEGRRLLEYEMLTYSAPVIAQRNTIIVNFGDNDDHSYVTLSAQFEPACRASVMDVADSNGAALVAAANSLGRHLGVDVHVIDAGLKTPPRSSSQ